MSITPNISISQSIPIICLIWIVGILITLPWALVFQVVYFDPTTDDGESLSNVTQSHPELPFCLEIWDKKEQEIAYFFVNNVLICFLLPLGLIIVCNAVIWKNVLETHYSTSYTINTSSQCSSATQETGSCLRDIQRRRKLRVLKLFTGMTFVFFAFWLPLYLIMARVKLSYTDTFHGSPVEQHVLSILIPLAQLLGSFNSCVNPVLYALLNQRFRPKWRFCPCFTKLMKMSKRQHDRRENNSIAIYVADNFRNVKNTRV